MLMSLELPRHYREIVITRCLNLQSGAFIMTIPPCKEYVDFERYLRESRKIDDNIILVLNKTDGTKDQCSTLWGKLEGIHQERNTAIRNCIRELEGTYIVYQS
jgi:hypothetical protein